MRAALAGTALLLSACAGLPPDPAAAYDFPEAFDVTQTVTVSAEGGSQELIASLTRRGRDLEVTLFDPVFSLPILTAHSRSGRVTEEWHGEVRAPGEGVRLVELLTAVFEARYARSAPGTARASTTTLRVVLEGVPESRACPFPATVEVTPRLSGAMRVRVRTLEVACRSGHEESGAPGG